VTQSPTYPPRTLHGTGPDPRSAAENSAGRHGLGFWLIAGAFLVAMAFNTVPTPLYPLYQARDGFSTLTVTVVFAVYALGVAVSLVSLGHVSDWVGRKRILLVALALQVLSAGIFLLAPALAGLLTARFVAGVGIGMITATATAHLHELHAAHRPDDGPGRFEVVSTGANIGGLALGPLIAGFLAEYVSAPLRTPYIVFGVLLLLAMVAVSLAPETVQAPPTRPAYRLQGISVEHGDRTGYLTAAASGFSAFAIIGVYTALSAGFVAGTLHRSNHLLAGTVAFSFLAAATVGQLATSRLSLRRRQIIGLAGQSIGLVGLAAGIQTAGLALFLIAGTVAGAGAGVLFKSAIGAVAAMAAPTKRGEALSGLFLICYAGMSLPAIGVGVAAHYTPITTVMYFFCAALLLVLVTVAVLASRADRIASARG
jgi:MFS family permease